MAMEGRKNGAGAAENIDAILRFEKQEEQKLALHHRIFHTNLRDLFTDDIHELVTQRRSHLIRLPTYQPKMLAIRKRTAIDGSAATGLS
jgi:hypothetical protein